MKGNSLVISVRRARPEDAAVLAEHNSAMARETEGARLDPRTVLEGTRAVLGDPQKGFYLVAESGGEVVGQLMVSFEWSDWRDADFWWLQSVYVRPEARRRGVFRRLFEELLRLARENGQVCGLRLYTSRGNAPAHATYETLGMHQARYVMYELMLNQP